MTNTKLYGAKLNGRSKITNGKGLLPEVDGRSIWSRRLRDLIQAHTADCGGKDRLSAAEASLVRRCAVICVELEHLETRFHVNGAASANELDLYSRTTNTLRRLFESLNANNWARPPAVLEGTARAIRTIQERHARPTP